MKGVGEAAVQALVAERTARGPYTGIEDLCRRLDLNRVNKRAFEALIRSGSLDSFGSTRNTLMTRLPAAMQMGEQNSRAKSTGQVDLFGLASGPAMSPTPAAQLKELPEWPQLQRLTGERKTLGLYLTGHPVAQHESELRFLTHGRIADLVNSPKPPPAGETGRWQSGRNVTVGGLVFDIRKRGNRISLVLEDRSGRMEVMMFDDVYQQHRSLIVEDAILLIEGQLRWDDFIEGWRINAKKFIDLDRARELQARRLVIHWPRSLCGVDPVLKLAEALKPYVGGNCGVTIKYETATESALIALDEQWSVRPGKELMEKLDALIGRDNLRVLYGPAAGGSGNGVERAGN